MFIFPSENWHKPCSMNGAIYTVIITADRLEFWLTVVKLSLSAVVGAML
jgi:hypothetical protein